VRPLASLPLSPTSASCPLLQADEAHGQARSYHEQAQALLERAREKLKEAGGAARHLLEAAEQAIKVGLRPAGPRYSGPRYSGPTGGGRGIPSLDLLLSLLCNKLKTSARIFVYEASAVSCPVARMSAHVCESLQTQSPLNYMHFPS
jgi:hypothetical protein